MTHDSARRGMAYARRAAFVAALREGRVQRAGTVPSAKQYKRREKHGKVSAQTW